MARILVIEDNPVNLELLVDLLEAWGHRTLVATDGDEGLAVVRRERPALVICDLQMPGRDGYSVAAAIRADPVLRHLPLIAVTAFARVGDRERAIEAGFDDALCAFLAEVGIGRALYDAEQRLTVTLTEIGFRAFAPARGQAHGSGGGRVFAWVGHAFIELHGDVGAQ